MEERGGGEGRGREGKGMERRGNPKIQGLELICHKKHKCCCKEKMLKPCSQRVCRKSPPPGLLCDAYLSLWCSENW